MPARSVDALASLGVQLTFHTRAVAAVPRALARHPREVLGHAARIATRSGVLLMVGCTGGLVFAMFYVSGVQLGLEGHRGLDITDVSPLVGVMAASVSTHEFAPAVAGIILAAKVGTGYTTELGALRVAGTLDESAVPTMVATRVLGALLAIGPIQLVALLISYVVVGVTVVQLSGHSQGTFDFYTARFLPPLDIVHSLLKTLLFALVVTLVHCYQGCHARGGALGVGHAAGRAPRTSIVLMLFIDIVLSIQIWGLHQKLPWFTP